MKSAWVLAPVFLIAGVACAQQDLKFLTANSTVIASRYDSAAASAVFRKQRFANKDGARAAIHVG